MCTHHCIISSNQLAEVAFLTSTTMQCNVVMIERENKYSIGMYLTCWTGTHAPPHSGWTTCLIYYMKTLNTFFNEKHMCCPMYGRHCVCTSFMLMFKYYNQMRYHMRVDNLKKCFLITNAL